MYVLASIAGQPIIETAEDRYEYGRVLPNMEILDQGNNGISYCIE